MNTDSFLGLMRAKDNKREEVARLRRELAAAEAELREMQQRIDAETAPRTVSNHG